jgi:predicted SAM-dependent methyltransferase
MTRLNLGAGNSGFQGFTSVDLYDDAADVKADLCDLPFDDNSVDEIICLQTIEHISYDKTEKMFQEMHRVLKEGCNAHIECPDLLYAAKEIVATGDIDDKWIKHIWGEYYRPWDTNRYPDAENHEGSKHRTGFTLKRMKRICEPLGFKVTEASRKHMDVPETLAVELRK